MAATNRNDWDALKAKLQAALKAGQIEQNWDAAAKYLGVKLATLRSAASREWGITQFRGLMDSTLADDIPNRLGTDVIEALNSLDINYVGDHVRTLDDLIRECKVDLEIWRAADFKANSWEVGMKVKRDGGDLIVVAPLYQIKAYFVRIQPIAIMPMITPVEMKIKFLPPPKPAGAEQVRRALIIPDAQIGFRRRLNTRELIPFHDRRALDVAVQIARAEHIDSIEFIGDWLDLSEWSTHWTPEPEFFWTTQPALIEITYWLSQFHFVPVKRLLEANHERRMRDWINSYARAAYGIRPADELELPASLSIERLVPFEKLGVQYIIGYPDNYYWLNNNVLIRHGDVVRAGPGDSAKAIVTKTTYTTVFGHIHRRELVSRRIKTRDGDAFQTAFSPGCICHIDGRVPGSKSDDQWQQGLGIVEYTDTSENLIPIAIENGRALYGGKIYCARDGLDTEIDSMILKALEKMKI